MRPSHIGCDLRLGRSRKDWASLRWIKNHRGRIEWGEHAIWPKKACLLDIGVLVGDFHERSHRKMGVALFGARTLR